MACLKAEWDTAHGRTLYDKGFTYVDIGKACKTTDNAVISYARRNWPPRQCDADRFAKKFPNGHAAKTIPRHPPGQPRARPLAEGASTLPPLRSLTFGDD